MDKINKIILAAAVAVVLIIGVFNCIVNEKFWELSISNVLTLLVALIITFLLTQKTTEVRRKKDVVVKMLDRLYILLSDIRMVKIQSQETIDFVKIQNRTISNKITCLEKFAKDLKFEEEIRKMKTDFDSYENFFSEHMSDLDYLIKSERTFNNKMQLLDNQCDNILAKLYTK